LLLVDLKLGWTGWQIDCWELVGQMEQLEMELGLLVYRVVLLDWFQNARQ
jgi:hypothetical protein